MADRPDGRRLPIQGKVEPATIGPRGPDFQQLWWLRLGEAGTTVEGAGPLDPLGDGEGRFPVVAAGPDGSLNLAYLVKPGGAPHHEIRVAPVDLDQATGTPTARTDRARTLARCCHPTPPIFSPDGSSILVVSAISTQIDIIKLFLGRVRPDPPGCLAARPGPPPRGGRLGWGEHRTTRHP